jgi:ABC-2 type transport system ATP-binding protein
VTGIDAAAIGDLAATYGIAVHQLISRHASLEEAYLDLTGTSTDYRAASPPPGGSGAPDAPPGSGAPGAPGTPGAPPGPGAPVPPAGTAVR